MSKREIRSVRDLILLWGDPPGAYESLAADVGNIEWSAVQYWARRGRIPAKHIPAVVSAAAKRGFPDITVEFVLKLSLAGAAA